jgi:hypothetical protein
VFAAASKFQSFNDLFPRHRRRQRYLGVILHRPSPTPKMLGQLLVGWRGASHCVDHSSFDLHRRDTENGPSVVPATLQNRLRDIVAVSTSALGRVAWAHPIATIIKELASKEGVGVLPRARSVLGMLGQQALDTVQVS